VVVILYADGHKDLATQMENLPVAKRDIAPTAIYTDFTELAEASRVYRRETVALVSGERQFAIAN